LQLLREVHFYRDILLAEDGDVDGVVLASKLTLCGYRVAVRQALGGGQGTAVFSNLRHSFLLVTAPLGCACAGVDYIVEVKLLAMSGCYSCRTALAYQHLLRPSRGRLILARRRPLPVCLQPHFREQFEISQPTARYGGLLAMLPAVFVGTAAELLPLVQLLCSEMTLAFEQHGLSLPPWRQSKSLLSKWLPSKLRDYDLSPYGSPRAASPEPLFPLTCFAVSTQLQLQHGHSHPASESVSGSITPAFSGGKEEEDGSPRAVLHSASTALLSQQLTGTSPTLSGGVAAPRKSLLSSSLAATGRRALSMQQQSRRSAGSTSDTDAVRQLQQPELVDASTRHAHSNGMAYRVSSQWQQPAIRTVKMQGYAPVATTPFAAPSSK
jgi:hypothetical protein